MPKPNPLAESWHPTPGCKHKPGQVYTREPCVCGRELWPPRGRGRGESLYSPRRIEAKMRAAQALRLRTAGHTYRAIAARLGYNSPQAAWGAVHRTIDEVTAQRNYEERHRAEGGRPHYSRPTREEVERVSPEMDHQAADDRRMNAERIETAEEMIARILSGRTW